MHEELVNDGNIILIQNEKPENQMKSWPYFNIWSLDS